ncbi:MAG: hypothetical protein V4730_11720 [Pseudomonadota bacterium]
MKFKRLPIPDVISKFFAFNGGLDYVTSPVEMPPGVLRAGSNVEIAINGRYSRLAGYERYSGKTRPSTATYAILTCTITGSVSLGDVLTDNAGTSYGTVIALPSGQAVLTLITGTFSTGNIKVGATVVGTCVGAQSVAAASTPALNATYNNLAADIYRALIAVVPGSGNILGVKQYNGSVYAFRNNAGGTAAVMHVNSASGWTAVALGREVSFTSGGTYEIVAGNTIAGATSGATAVITKVILTSGTWAAGTAAGRLFFASQTGTFQAENLDVGASLNVATIAGNSSAITLLPGGRYEFDIHNFGGGTGTKKMYGADGVNKGFEFDGTTFVQITTGMTTDTPKFVKQHKNHLFFSFSGSAQHSGIGTPYTFTIISGAGELACGDTIAGFIELAGTQAGAAMGIKTRNRTLVLYGNDSGDWNLVSYSEESGALPYTMQFITQGVSLDDQGITLLATTQNYGNFQSSVVSDKITPSLNDLIDSAISSCIVRQKNQYRVFFSGGDAFYMTFAGNKILGITKASLPNPVLCISSDEGASGKEEIYFGSSDGYVYQMDIGTSFDGAAITWTAELAYNHFGSPRQLKQFRKAVTEVTGGSYSEFYLSYSLGYGSTEYDSAPTSTNTTNLAATNWDTGTWDALFWDGRALAPAESDLTGTAENISLIYSGSSDEYEAFTLNSAIVHFTPRRSMH